MVIRRASADWLLLTFTLPTKRARFAFAPEERVPGSAIPFDMFHESGFGHRGDDCSFETLQKEFRIRDPKVMIISEIIHEADLVDGKFGRREGYGIDEIL